MKRSKFFSFSGGGNVSSTSSSIGRGCLPLTIVAFFVSFGFLEEDEASAYDHPDHYGG